MSAKRRPRLCEVVAVGLAVGEVFALVGRWRWGLCTSRQREHCMMWMGRNRGWAGLLWVLTGRSSA